MSTSEYPQSPTKGRQSNIAVRSFVISRTDHSDKRASMGGSMAMSSSRGMSGGMSLSHGVAQKISHSGIADFKGDREKEKVQLQGLNERLANYIEKIHFLSAECQRLELENDALRKQKGGEDLQPIRDAYENEIAELRKALDLQSTKEGASEVKMVSLNDEIARLNDLINTYEEHAKDYRKQLAVRDAHIGDLEGELAALRARMATGSDDADKARDLVTKYQEQIKNLRGDLDSATVAHIEAECHAQTKTEEAAFYKDLLDQIEMMKPEPVKIKGMDAAEFWQSHMKKAIRDIQQHCDEKVGMIQADCEAKFSTQMSALQSGSVMDTMQLGAAKEEVSKLRTQLSGVRSDYAAMAQKLAVLQSERDGAMARCSSMEMEMDEMKVKYEHQIAGLNAEMSGVLEELRMLQDAKLSMELEIACYKKMLEGEESRMSMKSLFEHATGGQSGGGMSLSGALHASQSAAKMQVQKSAKGAVGFASIDHSGGNVIIENNGASHAGSVNIGGWKLQKKVNNQVVHAIDINDFSLASGATFSIWAKGTKDKADAPNMQIADIFSFGVGNCVWCLLDKHGEEKATLTATFL